MCSAAIPLHPTPRYAPNSHAVSCRRTSPNACYVMTLDESPLVVVADVGAVFDRLRVPYVVGGSVASSFYGIPRSTQDADIVAALNEDLIAPFVQALGEDYYADADMIRDAVVRRASCNIVHRPTMFKIDIFIMRGDSYSRGEMQRGIVASVVTTVGARDIRFATAEDTLLQKLAWYKLGGEISDRQWHDVLGILRVQTTLDDHYLDEWADMLDVSALLRRARTER
jgi:hypothetical protein